MAFLSMRIKVLASLIVLTALFGLGMVVFAKTVVAGKLQGMLKEKGEALVRRIALDCVNPVITERNFEITMMFKDLMAAEKDIVYAYVLNEDGRELAHTFDRGVPRELKLAHQPDLPQASSSKDLITDKGLIHDIAVPLLRGQVGVLHIGFSNVAIENDVRDIVKAIILFSFAVLAVGIGISAGFSRAITGPLMRLAGAAEAFGRGESPPRVVITTDDEIGELSRIFNAMIEKRKQAEAEREQLIHELQAAMKKVKTLSGMLPLCSSCKKVRDDKGYWNQIEVYISEHSDAEVSHGLCPECTKKLYPDQWEKMQRANRE